MIFANIMKDKPPLKLFWKKALRKYRFVVMTADSFEERLSIKLSRLNIFAFSGFVVFFCFFSTVLLITTTPLTEYVPGKANSEIKNEFITILLKHDSLLNILESQNAYLQNVRNIISGGELITPKTIEHSKNQELEVSFERSIADSVLRAEVESKDMGTIRINKKTSNEVLLFFPPVFGMITDGFSPLKKHFGVDLVAKEKTKISATLEGTVIISHWTSKTGYVIGVQHKNNYFSLYKHNSLLLKSVGDFVGAGDPIAIIGNSGELSSGPHLHFELWRRGIPVDPEDYIIF